MISGMNDSEVGTSVPSKGKRRHYLVFPLMPDLLPRRSCRSVPRGSNIVLFVSICYPYHSYQSLDGTVAPSSDVGDQSYCRKGF